MKTIKHISNFEGENLRITELLYGPVGLNKISACISTGKAVTKVGNDIVDH